MSERVRAFIFGLTHSFIPVDYSNTYQLGEVSKRISKKHEPNRRMTRGKIEQIKAEAKHSNSIEQAY